MTEHTRDDVAPAPLVVAVDGPSGSGKSSVSKAVARRLGAAYLDTGAMYRAVAWHCLNEGVDLADAEAVAAAAVAMDLDQSTDPDVEAVRVGGTDVTEAIRGPEVTDTVSTVAVVIPVREELHRRQRAVIAAAGRMVAEGRDITTVVAPDAHARVLLTASEAVRTARRSGQLAAAGRPASMPARCTVRWPGATPATPPCPRSTAPPTGWRSWTPPSSTSSRPWRPSWPPSRTRPAFRP